MVDCRRGRVLPSGGPEVPSFFSPRGDLGDRGGAGTVCGRWLPIAARSFSLGRLTLRASFPGLAFTGLLCWGFPSMSMAASSPDIVLRMVRYSVYVTCGGGGRSANRRVLGASRASTRTEKQNSLAATRLCSAVLTPRRDPCSVGRKTPASADPAARPAGRGGRKRSAGSPPRR